MHKLKVLTAAVALLFVTPVLAQEMGGATGPGSAGGLEPTYNSGDYNGYDQGEWPDRVGDGALDGNNSYAMSQDDRSCMHVTLTRRLHALAPGLTARSALEKFAAVQMIDVHLPTTDGREIMLTRYTHPEPELQLLIDQLKLRLPPQPPPRITTTTVTQAHRRREDLLA
jgi:hypothetical protein